jgi:hypothetical protein
MQISDRETQLNCVLDGYALNGAGNIFPVFSAKSYSSIYYGIVTLIEAILEDSYHGPHLTDQLARWARKGW